MAILIVPVTKGKATVEIDTDSIPDAVLAEVYLQGLKVLVNRGMSKITKETYPDEEEMKAAAMAVAEKQVEAIKDGKVKLTGQKAAGKASGAIMTEARRLARALTKDQIKAAGLKISTYEPAEITAAANAMIDSDPTIIELAKANLEERAKKPILLDVTKMIKPSEKLIKKAEERKAEKKGQLSAKQAGKVKPRAKGEAQATAH